MMSDHKSRIVLIHVMNQAERKALDSLGRYKFEMFGYWSSTWVKYNQLGADMGLFEKKKPNPFKTLVDTARDMQ